MVRVALFAVGLPGMTDPAGVTFRTPICRDGAGWRVQVELPAGVDAVAVVERRGDLAAALRLSVERVLPTAGSEHARCLDLWVDLEAVDA
jgi:S-DNA-T family DNA segregation ATPase FtsK/SpoIIIE